MRIQLVTVFRVVVAVIAICSISQASIAIQKTQIQQGTAAKEEGVTSPLNVADIMPASKSLSGRFSALKTSLASLATDRHLSAFEEELSKTQRVVDAFSDRLQALKAAKRYNYEELATFKVEIFAASDALEKGWGLLTERVTHVEHWSNEWSEEKERWKSLKSALPEDMSDTTAELTIAEAQKTIVEAKKLISDHLKPLLGMQHKAADIQSSIDSLVVEVDDLLRAARSDLFRKSAPSAFSLDYYAQLRSGLQDGVRQGIDITSWSEWQVLQQNGFVISLQALLSLVVAIIIFGNRASLLTESRLRFIAERPFSAAVFAGFLAFMSFYKPSQGPWRVLFVAIVGLSIARLAGRFIAGTWRRRVVYGLVILLVLKHFLQASGLPQPLFRMFVFLVALIALLLCGWHALKDPRLGVSRLYKWALWLGTIVAAFMLLAELGGYAALAAHLLEAVLRTNLIVMAGWVLMRSAEGGLHWTFYSSPLTKVPFLHSHAGSIVPLCVRLLNVLVAVWVIALVVVALGLFESHLGAIQYVISVRFTVGSHEIAVGTVLAAVLVLYGSFLASRVIQSVLRDEVFPRRRVETGAQISMGRLVHYAIILVGFLLALGALGVNFTNITIIGGALGVGIGFGLQTIVNNFVCGLILLFERPVRVGDYVEIGDLWAEVKKIGLRSTIVVTFDRAEIVVPNSDLITNQVTNWTRSDRVLRLKIPVGVAYGSDVPLVMKILYECSQNKPSVLSSPQPQVLFMGFGESSLDFEIRVFIRDVDNMFVVKSEILQEIDQEFRKAGVEIPFPQRDLHLRSVDEKASKRLLGSELKKT